MEPLSALAAQINLAVADVNNAVALARRAGELLIEAKSRVRADGGKWLPWLEANCQVAERTAQLYMAVAGFARDNPQRVADFETLREAQREIARERRGQDLAGAEFPDPEQGAAALTEFAPGAWINSDKKIIQVPLADGQRAVICRTPEGWILDVTPC